MSSCLTDLFVIFLACWQDEVQIDSRCDVLVCSLGHKPMMKEKLHVLRDLWAAGLKADLIHDSTKVGIIPLLSV